MRTQRILRFLWALSSLVIISLACTVALSSPTASATPTKPTDTATATGAVATAPEGSGVLETPLPEITPTELGFDFFGGDVGEKPADIPVMQGGELEEASQTYVEYSLEAENVAIVVEFYEREMPMNGWTKLDTESRVEAEIATLVYSKENRKATVTIEIDDFFGGTVVTISIVTV